MEQAMDGCPVEGPLVQLCHDLAHAAEDLRQDHARVAPGSQEGSHRHGARSIGSRRGPSVRW